MSDFGYVLELLEAKGWYLYEGKPHAKLSEVISTGRARSLHSDMYYHLMPATAHSPGSAVPGRTAPTSRASRPPSAPPRSSSGVRILPGVPAPRAREQATILASNNASKKPAVAWPAARRRVCSRPACATPPASPCPSPSRPPRR